MKGLTDLALLDLLKEDSDDAFNEIYARYWDLVYAIACKKLNNRDEAKDVVHDLFMLIWIKRHSIHITTTFIGYIYIILKNKLTDLNRRQTLRIKHDDEAVKTYSFAENDVFEQLVSKDLAHQLHLEIQDMPIGMRQVFLMSRKSSFQLMK